MKRKVSIYQVEIDRSWNTEKDKVITFTFETFDDLSLFLSSVFNGVDDKNKYTITRTVTEIDEPF